MSLKRLRVRPDEAVYVGDDPHVDGLAANRTSIPFVWFNPRRATPAASIVIHDQITHLKHLRSVI